MTQQLQDLLTPDARSGVYRLSGRTSAKTLGQRVEAAGWRFLLLDGSDVRNKPAFLDAAARALRFPEWAGHNWDAFEELVNDLSWLPEAPGRVLLVDRLGHLAAAQPDQVRLALEILRSAAANRQAAGEAPLIVLVRGAGTAAAHLTSVEMSTTASSRV